MQNQHLQKIQAVTGLRLRDLLSEVLFRLKKDAHQDFVMVHGLASCLHTFDSGSQLVDFRDPDIP